VRLQTASPERLGGCSVNGSLVAVSHRSLTTKGSFFGQVVREQSNSKLAFALQQRLGQRFSNKTNLLVRVRVLPRVVVFALGARGSGFLGLMLWARRELRRRRPADRSCREEALHASRGCPSGSAHKRSKIPQQRSQNQGSRTRFPKEIFSETYLKRKRNRRVACDLFNKLNSLSNRRVIAFNMFMQVRLYGAARECIFCQIKCVCAARIPLARGCIPERVGDECAANIQTNRMHACPAVGDALRPDGSRAVCQGSSSAARGCRRPSLPSPPQRRPSPPSPRASCTAPPAISWGLVGTTACAIRPKRMPLTPLHGGSAVQPTRIS
jgi:hypothetical protein